MFSIKSISGVIIVFITIAFGFLLFGSSEVRAALAYSNCSNLEYTPAGVLVGTYAAAKDKLPTCTTISNDDLGFKIPSLGDLLTFAIRAFFVIAGLAGLFYLLLGALGWVTSGGDKDAVTAAREKIQAAVLGMILIVAVLAIIWTLEQVIFNRRICFGLSCGLTLPGLLEKSGDTAVSWVPTGAGTGYNVTSSSTDDAACCICKKDDGTFGEVVNSRYVKCGVNGTGEPL